MTLDDTKKLLDEGGYAYQIVTFEGGARFDFRDRGSRLHLFVSENDPGFVVVGGVYNVDPEISGRADFDQHMLSVMENLKAIKLSVSRRENSCDLTVAIEAFVDPESPLPSSVFYRALDAIRSASGEFYASFVEPSTEPMSAADDPTATLEAALRAGAPLPDAECESVPSRIRSSLALLEGKDGSGSAFCIGSGPSGSLYVTNAHVVEGNAELTLYRQTPAYEKGTAKVVAVGDPKAVDLAIVFLGTANVPSVTIAEHPVVCDAPIAIAGYPRVQFAAAREYGELSSSIHFGTITMVTKGGSVLLHDAPSRPGNSGGPVFDPVSGAVHGVEQSGWEDDEESSAIGAPVLRAFMKAHADVFKAIENEPANLLPPAS